MVDKLADAAFKILPVEKWEQLDEEERKMMQLSMRYNIIALFFSVNQIIFCFFNDNIDLIKLLLIPVAMTLINFKLIQKLFYEVGAVLCLSSFVSILLFSKFLHPSIPFELFVIPISVGVLTGFKNQKLAYFIFGSSLFFFFLIYGVIPKYSSNLAPISNTQNENFFVFIICSIFAAVLALVYHFRKEENQYKRKIIEQKKHIQQQKEAIQKQSEQLLIYQDEQHKIELSSKQKDLELVQSNNVLKSKVSTKVITDLEELKNVEDISYGLNKIILELKGQQGRERQIDFLETNIDVVNDAFFEKLSNQFPALSKTEKEICSYLKLGMSSKEMASLRNTSPNTINVTKTRLRKKIGLDSGEDLVAFLQKV